MRKRWWQLAAVATMGLFQFGSCDPSTQAVLEDGIVTASNSLLTSILQGLLQAATAAGTV